MLDSGVDQPEEGSGGVELLYTPSESVFAAVAPAMVANGWSVFPQQTSGERRLPGKVFGQTIRWSEDHDLKNRLPSPEVLTLWCQQCAPLNVACVFGPASGNTFAVDIDVTDEDKVREILALADEILGPTAFRREGMSPKIALIYRHGPDEKELVPSRSRKFASMDANGNVLESDDGLEILGAGKLITFHGRHHKTGNYFKWLASNPIVDGPEAATLVTPDQVQTFLEAVDARWRFHRGASFSADAATWQWDEKSSMMVPKLALAAGGSAWSEDEDGKVCDGREAYLSSLAWRTVHGNAEALSACRELGDEAVKKFKQDCAVAVADKFAATAVMSGRWRLASLRHEARDKVSRLVDKILSGRMPARKAPQSDPRRGEAAFTMPPPQETHADPELSFLCPNRAGPAGRKVLRGWVEPPVPGAPCLDIPADRSALTAEIQQKLETSFVAFFADVYGHPAQIDLGGRKVRVHILKAPTGAGKTSRGIRFIAADPRTYQDVRFVDPRDGQERDLGPVVFLLPTYANIDELRHRAQVLGLDPSLSDKELRGEAERLGLIQEDELDGKLAELRRDAINCGLRTMVYQGKIRAGCKMEDKVKLAMAAGIGTAAFCKSTRKAEDGTVEEVLCEAYHDCPAIGQRKEIRNVHVVFLPHSFLSLSIPEELSCVRAVVADERIHHLFLHTATFSALSLSIGRKPPRLSKKEREAGASPTDLLAERERASKIALDALRHQRCPAEALLSFRNEAAADDIALYPGRQLVQSALRVCSSAIQRDGNLSPEMSLNEVRELCSQPTGKDVREEWRFWTIVSERMDALQQDRMKYGEIRKLEKLLARDDLDDEHRIRAEASVRRIRSLPDLARGAKDARIQYLTEYAANGSTTSVIRISWRTEPNWLGTPTLLLDASAAPPVIAKVWKLGEADIVVHDIVEDIGRSLNVKTVGVVNQTFSNASIVASPSAPEMDRVAAARNLANVRQAIATVAALHGDGRVVVGTSILLRRVINNGWAAPDNVDWCHYGAMRGLDMFKHHAAALSIGRMEVPVRTIDGLVAALTYDDPDPEPPFDRFGTGSDADGKSLRLPMGEQRSRLRSGHTAVVPVPMFPGRWGRLIQRQYREEETLQFVGRLRPVYREGRTPVWYALSSVVPEEMIVDELVHIDDLLYGPVHLWEAARRTEGVVDAEVIAATCADIFRSGAGSVAQAMALMGLSAETGEITSRAGRGHARLRWRRGSEPWRFAFVRASVPDPVARLRDALEKEPFEPGGVEIELLGSPEQGMARSREEDNVDKAIGKLPARMEAERHRLWSIGSKMLDSPEGIEGMTSAQLFPFKGEEQPHALPLAQIQALVAINAHWASQGGMAEDRLLPVVEISPAQVAEDREYHSYDQLGDNIRDEDHKAA